MLTPMQVKILEAAETGTLYASLSPMERYKTYIAGASTVQPRAMTVVGNKGWLNHTRRDGRVVFSLSTKGREALIEHRSKLPAGRPRKLTAEQVAEIRAERADGGLSTRATQLAAAERYRVSLTTVKNAFASGGS